MIFTHHMKLGADIFYTPEVSVILSVLGARFQPYNLLSKDSINLVNLPEKICLVAVPESCGRNIPTFNKIWLGVDTKQRFCSVETSFSDPRCFRVIFKVEPIPGLPHTGWFIVLVTSVQSLLLPGITDLLIATLDRSVVIERKFFSRSVADDPTLLPFHDLEYGLSSSIVTDGELEALAGGFEHRATLTMGGGAVDGLL